MCQRFLSIIYNYYLLKEKKFTVRIYSVRIVAGDRMRYMYEMYVSFENCFSKERLHGIIKVLGVVVKLPI